MKILGAYIRCTIAITSIIIRTVPIKVWNRRNYSYQSPCLHLPILWKTPLFDAVALMALSVALEPDLSWRNDAQAGRLGNSISRRAGFPDHPAPNPHPRIDHASFPAAGPPGYPHTTALPCPDTTDDRDRTTTDDPPCGTRSRSTRTAQPHRHRSLDRLGRPVHGSSRPIICLAL